MMLSGPWAPLRMCERRPARVGYYSARFWAKETDGLKWLISFRGERFFRGWPVVVERCDLDSDGSGRAAPAPDHRVREVGKTGGDARRQSERSAAILAGRRSVRIYWPHPCQPQRLSR